MTLLSKAKKRQNKRIVTKEQVDLAVAWAKNEITLTQVAEALSNKNVSFSYSILARALKQHIIKKQK